MNKKKKTFNFSYKTQCGSESLLAWVVRLLSLTVKLDIDGVCDYYYYFLYL